MTEAIPEAIASELKAIRALLEVQKGLAVEALKNSAAALTTSRTLTSQYQELRGIIDDISRDCAHNRNRLDEMRVTELAKAKAITDAAYMAEARANYVEAASTEAEAREERLAADTIRPPPPPNVDDESNGNGGEHG